MDRGRQATAISFTKTSTDLQFSVQAFHLLLHPSERRLPRRELALFVLQSQLASLQPHLPGCQNLLQLINVLMSNEEIHLDRGNEEQVGKEATQSA